jgi:hypothetical protein
VEQPVYITVKPVTTTDGDVDHTPRYFIQTTFNLQQLGFTQFLDFTIPELPHPAIFRALAGYDHSHTVILHEIYPHIEDQPASRQNRFNYMEFESVLADGTKINSNNAPLPLPMIPPPDMVIMRMPRTRDAKNLFEEHMKAVNNLVTKKGSYLRAQPPGEFAHTFENDWRRIIEHNINAGLLRKADHGNKCWGSPWIVLRYFRSMIMG